DRDDASFAEGAERVRAFQTGDRERAGRFQDGARIFERVLNRRADFVRRHRDERVDVSLAEIERDGSDLFDGHAVGEDAHAIETDALPFVDRAAHRFGSARLDTDDAHFRVQLFHDGADPGNEPSAADRYENRRDVARLSHDFETDRRLAGNDVGIVV